MTRCCDRDNPRLYLNVKICPEGAKSPPKSGRRQHEDKFSNKSNIESFRFHAN